MISGTSPPRSVPPAARSRSHDRRAADRPAGRVRLLEGQLQRGFLGVRSGLARVNGVDIRQSDLTLAEEDVGDDMKSASPEAKREQLITYLADIILVTQAAEKRSWPTMPTSSAGSPFCATSC